MSGTFAGSGVWENSKILKVKQYCSEYPQATFLDIGANIGTISLYARALGHHVIAVEPNPINWPLLRRSLLLNNFTSRFTLLPYALSDAKRNYTMRTSRRNIGDTYVSKKSINESISNVANEFLVQSVQLKDVFGYIHTNTVLVKIDVQAHECHALADGKELFQRFHVPYIFMEWGYYMEADIDCNAGMVSLLVEHGYKPMTVKDRPLPVETWRNKTTWGMEAKISAFIDVTWIKQ